MSGLDEMSGPPVTAIAAADNPAAVGTMSAVAEAGRRVSGHVAHSGYDVTVRSATREVSLSSGDADVPARNPLP
jgi:hypothetical protein